jgi:hypothetical protein
MNNERKSTAEFERKSAEDENAGKVASPIQTSLKLCESPKIL